MKQIHWQAAIHGVSFLCLLFNFFTKDFNWYRTGLLLILLIGYTTIAILYHLDKNRKL